ncbi:TLD-domain-containing protein [Piromyces finnis]|uniref:Oxidation resistance protein 1 n=1 Tax=Piromyces finnis TaxID=1754191 RepID=A0A1Y1VA02_9FUNG|nr:TLD-domain-containing protein [Piromyces finnis]|eukprot:ORX50753.1 TLD-domain-containing protein [Piromyces finnis]
MYKRNVDTKTIMNNTKDRSSKYEKKNKKKIRKFFKNIFKKKSSSKKEDIEYDNLSDVSNCATINAPDEYNRKYSQLTQFDSSSEATIINPSVTSSTNDIYYNRFNSSTFPPNTSKIQNEFDSKGNTITSANEFYQHNQLKPFNISSNQNFLNSNITRASFYSIPSYSYSNIIPSGDHIPLKLIGRNELTTPIINNWVAEQIRTKIPHLYKEAIKWKLLYSIDQHGLSLNTLYSNVKHAGPCVMAIITDNDEIFGAFTPEPFDPTISKSYYGNGLSFIWKLNNRNNVDFYQSKNTNQYYMLADNHFIAMGGGNGKFGLYLNENLIDGYLSPCMTFDYNSNILENENFECFGLEIWGFEF